MTSIRLSLPARLAVIALCLFGLSQLVSGHAGFSTPSPYGGVPCASVSTCGIEDAPCGSASRSTPTPTFVFEDFFRFSPSIPNFTAFKLYETMVSSISCICAEFGFSGKYPKLTKCFFVSSVVAAGSNFSSTIYIAVPHYNPSNVRYPLTQIQRIHPSPFLAIVSLKRHPI
jgi:hypothetical protein